MRSLILAVFLLLASCGPSRAPKPVTPEPANVSDPVSIPLIPTCEGGVCDVPE